MSKLSPQDIQAFIDNKTKPIGALGNLETLAFQLCQYQNTLSPKLTQPSIIVFAADHGLADTGVSAYPKEVTAQMVLNFVAGGAAINTFCAQHQIDLSVVDAGVDFDFDSGITIKHHKIRRGSRNCLNSAAMTSEELDQSFSIAKSLIEEKHRSGCNIIGFGEMGIGNTSSAALIQHYALNMPLHACVGRGTGLDDQGLERKLAILQKVVSSRGKLETPRAILQEVGGYEIAMMVQAMISAYEHRMLVLVDGFIASAAALLAQLTDPRCRQAMIFCHQSEEIGHQHLLSALNAKPILKLNMRLGEGSGCALAYPIVQSAAAFLEHMASFDDAGVSQSEDH